MLICVLDLAMALLQFYEDQRQTVDEADEIRTLLVDTARDPELGSQKEVVVLGLIPVDDADRLVGIYAVVVLEGDLYAIFQQLVNLTIRLRWTHRTAVAG